MVQEINRMGKCFNMISVEQSATEVNSNEGFVNRSEDRQGTALPASTPNSTEHLTPRLILGNF